MKYYCSDWRKKNWVETFLSEKEILYFLKKEMFVYDSDNCGEDISYVGFSSGKYFKIFHSWYIEHDPEWQINNDFEITEVTKEEATHKGVISDRNWLFV